MSETECCLRICYKRNENITNRSLSVKVLYLNLLFGNLSRFTKPVAYHVYPIHPATVGCKHQFSSVVFFPKTYNSPKQLTNSNWGVLMTTPWNSQGHEKDRLRNCHRPEETGETWQLNILECPRWDSGNNKQKILMEKLV